MAEARKLKSCRWRIYNWAELDVIREPVTGAIMTFDSLAGASRWWSEFHSGDDPIREARRCTRCGAYFGQGSSGMLYAGRYYHLAHLPQPDHRRRHP